MTHRITGSDLARLVTFSDAVVAVAITVLVLPLVSVTAPADGRPFYAVITDNWPIVTAFLLTFLIVYIQWQGHHRTFENVVAIDDAIVRLNGLWLVTIAFLPWPSRMLDADGNGNQVVWLYCGTLFLNSALLHAIYRHGRRHPDLLRNPGVWPRRSLSFQFAAVFGVLTVVAVFAPRVALWSMWVVIPLRFLAQQDGPLRTVLWRARIQPSASADNSGPDSR